MKSKLRNRTRCIGAARQALQAHTVWIEIQNCFPEGWLELFPLQTCHRSTVGQYLLSHQGSCRIHRTAKICEGRNLLRVSGNIMTDKRVSQVAFRPLELLCALDQAGAKQKLPNGE